MINKSTGLRELAYVVKVDAIEPVVGSDNCEAAVVGGWKILVRKGTFIAGNLAIYFEVDSHLDTSKEEFAFLERKHGNVKTQKYTFNGRNPGFYSQGLLMSAADFGGYEVTEGYDKPYLHFGEDSFFKKIVDYGEGDFLTEVLGVTYAVAEDNTRKAKVNPDAKINAALARHPEFAKKYGRIVKNNKFLRWFFTTIWGGAKVAKATAFPTQFPFVHKSDEERCENMTWILENKTPFVKTTKIDGTSTLFVLERKPFNKREFYVCSRNVRQLTPDQKTFFNTENVYWQVENKFHIRDFLEKMLNDHPEWTYVALQGETAGLSENGEKIQGDPHKFGELRFFGYNFIDSVKGRWGSVEARNLTAQYGIEWVPIVDERYILPDDFEEFKKSADGPCEANGAHGAREGYVYRNVADPNLSFKNVSREYLAKHNG
jgi:hypothetical protein